jgi:hypothetical protein
MSISPRLRSSLVGLAFFALAACGDASTDSSDASADGALDAASDAGDGGGDGIVVDSGHTDTTGADVALLDTLGATDTIAWWGRSTPPTTIRRRRRR